MNVMADVHGEHSFLGEAYRILHQLDAARTGDGREDERLTTVCEGHPDQKAEKVVALLLMSTGQHRKLQRPLRYFEHERCLIEPLQLVQTLNQKALRLWVARACRCCPASRQTAQVCAAIIMFGIYLGLGMIEA
jgi:hypothetical protein